MLQESFVPESVAEQGGGQQAHYGMPAHQIAFDGHYARSSLSAARDISFSNINGTITDLGG
jgi:hypothetical protein